jgi:hypothetical protein
MFADQSAGVRDTLILSKFCHIEFVRCSIHLRFNFIHNRYGCEPKLNSGRKINYRDVP